MAHKGQMRVQHECETAFFVAHEASFWGCHDDMDPENTERRNSQRSSKPRTLSGAPFELPAASAMRAMVSQSAVLSPTDIHWPSLLSETRPYGWRITLDRKRETNLPSGQ